MNRRLLGLLLVAILIPAAGIMYLLATPRLLAVNPEAGANGVPAGTPLRLTFSRRMQTDSVGERLTINPPISGSSTWQGNVLTFLPDHPWPGGQKITVQLKAGASASGWLPLTIRAEASWSFTVGYPRLLYLYPADQTPNLYMLDPLAGQSEQLTNNPAGILEYDANEGGTTVYYSAQNPQGGSDLYRLSGIDTASLSAGEGTPKPQLQAERLLDCEEAQCHAPQVSPQGDYLAYERTGAPGTSEPAYVRVWLLPLKDQGNSAGGQPFPVDGDARHQTSQPLWSAQGRLAYYDSTEKAYVFFDPQDGQSQQFPNQTGQNGTWSPDGASFVAPEISFVSAGNPEQTGVTPIANSHLILFSLADGKTRDLTQAENLEDAAPAFSPDGKKLALARKYLDLTRWTPGRQLWLMGLDGSQAHPLTNDPYYNHYAFAWSPGGDQLAYVRFNQTVMTEPPEIWMVDPQTTRAKKLVTGGFAPQWIP